MPRSALREYNDKRDFSITNEPKGKAGKARKQALEFVIEKHGARRLHYDFRLELDGVMKSWAVTRGPSYDPKDKRLAVRTEDHPMEYNKFEGVIPDKQYGAGPVMIWDRGTWTPDEDPRRGLEKGHLVFHIDGTRMHGKWHLVRMQTQEKRENWLLIKSDDEYALPTKNNSRFLDEENTSAISGRTLEEIREGKPGKAKARTKSKTKVKAEKAPAQKMAKRKTPVAKTPSKAVARELAELQRLYGNVALATLVEYPPSGSDWLHEIKYDGYRLLAFIKDGKVVLQTRGKKDWTHKFQGLAEALSRLKVKDAVIDGEAAVLDEKGRTNFGELQAALSAEDDRRIEMWLFDLLHLDGRDCSDLPLIERKALLRKILPKRATKLHFSDHFESNPNLLEEACKIGAEGLVSRRKDSLYQGRRSREWVKSKCGLEQKFVIGGFMPAKDAPRAVGALLLGYYRNGKLHYAGKVGTGFTQKSAHEIYERLIPLKASSAPFEGKIDRGRRAYVWLQPEVLCEVAFWEWTADKHIRHASFKGLREDKAPQAVHAERPEPPPDDTKGRPAAKRASSSARSSKATTAKNNRNTRSSKSGDKDTLSIEGMVITHPEREVYPGTGITKGQVAEYYAAVMDYLFPFAEGRLLSLMRCTEDIAGECFFQRTPMKGGKGNVLGLTATHKGKKHTYLYTDTPAGIIELVQMNTIEFHAWQSLAVDIDHPNQLIFDLDPSEEVPFTAVKLAALDVKKRLADYGLSSFPRLTGGKGIHVVAPIKPTHKWPAIKAFAQGFAQAMQQDVPDAYIANMSKQKRVGKIFVDYLRNEYSSTAIVPFSLRARPGAPIAVPLSWSELDKVDRPQPYRLANYKQALGARRRRVIEDFLSLEQELVL